MVIHCSRKLAAKLASVSATQLEDDCPLGSWHGHLYSIDHSQCVLFCHDATRYCLFLPGLRKPHFAELGSKWFCQLYFATLARIGCPDAQIRRVEQALGPIRMDLVTDRSVQSSMRVARGDLDGRIMDVANVLELDPIDVSCELNDRPASISGKWIWPDKLMREAVAAL
jgi:hypothetical protein